MISQTPTGRTSVGNRGWGGRGWRGWDKHRKWQRWCGDRIRWLGHLMRTKSSLQSCPTPCVHATAEELVSEREGDRGAAGSITPTTLYNDTGSRLPTQRAITWNNPRSPSPAKLSNTIWSKRKNQSIFLLVSIMDRQDIARASAINLTCFAIAHKCILRKIDMAVSPCLPQPVSLIWTPCTRDIHWMSSLFTNNQKQTFSF